MVTLTFDLMTPKYIGIFPFHRGIMWPSLVKIRYTELKLLCGNLCGRPPAIPNHIRAYNKVVTTKYLAKFQSPRAITRPKIIGPERNVNLNCKSSLYTH